MSGKLMDKLPPELQSLIELLVLCAIAFVIVRGGIQPYVVQPFAIPTGSMIPTIQIGDMVVAEKLTYRFSHGPEQGDIVVFADPTGDHDQLIKRVIATSGQTVDIHDGKVWIDGEELDEPYIHDVSSQPGTVKLPVTLEDGELWMMGDNRPESHDSRYFGPQPVSAVKARAIWTHWPLKRFGKLE